MEKEFATYEQALALKELGFDEECFGYYNSDRELKPIDTDFINFRGVSEPSLKAPLYQQTFRWFRIKCKLNGYVELTDNSKNYYYDFTIYDSIDREYNDADCFDQAGRIYTRLKFDTHEEAESACIDKLIEIVKNKL